MDFFKHAYNQNTYLGFLADKFTFSKLLSPIDIDNSELESFKRLGTVTTKDDKTKDDKTKTSKKLPVFEIYVKPNTQLQRNRVQLRNLVAKQIQAEDGALAVYIDDQNKQWRFSFIAIEYRLTGKGIEREQTASKRFTYLLGVNIQTRTANKRFATIDKQSTLEDLQQAFAVEPLNKEFYGKLYQWYETAQTQVVFPNDEHAENHAQTSLIRLLTRLLFIWFIKEKNLINADLFDKEKLKTLIDYDQPSSFYKAILQNLFFATLNRPITERSFRTTKNGKANGTNYLITNIYRYQKYFIHSSENSIIALFGKTPFLNGGLFECLDREASDEEKQNHDRDRSIRPVGSAIRIDGFSDRADNQLAFPNELFFNEADSGLIDLFKQYQFTVEESTPLDVEVALDPELLGKVFENLLASYNPETGQQARKATGSFYTPREIVSYMVDESIKACLLEKAPPHDGDTGFYKERLQDLISLSDKTGKLPVQEEILIYPEEIPQLIKAISGIKIIDPAVGSGAFPMGLLQRMVALLAILDPNNELWQRQKLDELPDLKSIEQDLKTSEKISDTQAKQQAQKILSAKKQQIIDDFKHLDHNYLRKLYLIENCIYGVDIQPVAIQICKLRFFISLSIEQNPNRDKNDNYGIKALPNLETRFIVANSLLPLGEMPNQAGLFDQEIKELQKELAEVRHGHFSAKTLKTKRKYREQDKALRQTMLEELTQSGITPGVEASMQKIVNWDLYNQNAVADWFNPEWQFGVKHGFDIVIGNPPYIRQESIKEFKPQLRQSFSVFTGTADIYTYFYEKGVQLLSSNGHLCYITSNKWMRAKYGEKLRGFFKHQSQLKQIIDFEGEQIFENATVDTNILLCGKTTNTQINFEYQKQLPDDKNPLFTMAVKDLSTNAYTLQAPEILTLKKKIEQIGTPLKDWDIRINYGIKTGFNDAFIIDTAKRDELLAADPKSAEIIKPILRGRDVGRYGYKWAGKWLINSHNGDKNNAPINIDDYPAIKKHLNQYYPYLEKRQDKGITPYNLRNCAYLAEFEKEKIVYNDIAKRLSFSLSKSGEYFNNTVYFIADNNSLLFQLAVLNSNLIDWYYKQISVQLGVGVVRMFSVYVEHLPIPKISKAKQQPFIDTVDQILTAKQQGKDTTALETEIDKRVYQLYHLTPDEINIIEAKK